MVISQNNNNNDSSERTEVLLGEENVMNIILQFLSKVYRIDSCGDHRAPSVAIGVEEYKESLLDLKNRGTKLRFITDITKENIHYCKQVMKFAEEVRHIDGIKANFFVSETEYVATAARQEAQPIPQVIYSNVKDIVYRQQYVFEAFWNATAHIDAWIHLLVTSYDGSTNKYNGQAMDGAPFLYIDDSWWRGTGNQYLENAGDALSIPITVDDRQWYVLLVYTGAHAYGSGFDFWGGSDALSYLEVNIPSISWAYFGSHLHIPYRIPLNETQIPYLDLGCTRRM